VSIAYVNTDSSLSGRKCKHNLSEISNNRLIGYFILVVANLKSNEKDVAINVGKIHFILIDDKFEDYYFIPSYDELLHPGLNEGSDYVWPLGQYSYQDMAQNS
jgi:hypothetical protein